MVNRIKDFILVCIKIGVFIVVQPFIMALIIYGYFIGEEYKDKKVL